MKKGFKIIFLLILFISLNTQARATMNTDGENEGIITDRLSVKTTESGIHYITGFEIETLVSAVKTGNFKSEYF